MLRFIDRYLSNIINRLFHKLLSKRGTTSSTTIVFVFVVLVSILLKLLKHLLTQEFPITGLGIVFSFFLDNILLVIGRLNHVGQFHELPVNHLRWRVRIQLLRVYEHVNLVLDYFRYCDLAHKRFFVCT